MVLLVCVAMASILWNISTLVGKTRASYDRPADRRAVYGMLNMESVIGLIDQVLPPDREGVDVGFYLPGLSDSVSRNQVAMCLAYHLYPVRVRVVDRPNAFSPDYLVGYREPLARLLEEV